MGTPRMEERPQISTDRKGLEGFFEVFWEDGGGRRPKSHAAQREER